MRNNFLLILPLFLLSAIFTHARMNMGTITIEVEETKQVTSEPSTNYSVSGSWSKTGESISITSESDRSCKIWGVKEGTATLEWSGLINTTWEDMYWTVNVVCTGGGGNSGTPDTGFSDSWTSNGNYSISWFDNSKTVLHISNAKELAGLAYLVNNGYSDFSGKTVKLDADIDLDGKNWPTIGDGYNTYFKGNYFDGQNHTISGIYIVSQNDKQKHYGFFSLLSYSSIKNLRLQGKVSIEKSNPMNQGFDTYNFNGYSFIGGLVGFAHYVHFENCKVEMDVKCKRDHPIGYIVLGGIAGVSRVNSSSTIAMKNCSHIGNLYAGEWSGKTRCTVVGGLIGWSGLSGSDSWPGVLECCENISSEIYCSATDNYNYPYYYSVGGLVGEGYSELKHCRSIVDNIIVKNKSVYLSYLHVGGLGASKNQTTNSYSIVKNVNINSVTLENDKQCWGGITAVSHWDSKANFSNSDVTKTSYIILQEGYHGSTSYTSSQMKSDSFLEEMNIYPQLNLGKTIWTADDDGYPCITEAHYFGKTTIPVTSITLNKTSLSLQTGQSETLTASILPTNATNQTVTWSSSKESVVTVDSGKVTAKAKGNATITCTANDGSGVTATCAVTVTDPIIKVTSITLNKTSLTLEVEKSETLTATVKPDNATDKTVTWSSDKKSVAIVDSNGKVTAKAKGNATITCTANDGSGVTATCAVTVTDPIIKVTSITLNKTSITLEVEKSVTLTATVKPDNATNKTVTWSSEEESVATVDNNGKVTAIAKGTAKITCTANDGSGVAAECAVTVTVPKPDKIVLPDEATVMAGASITLTPEVTPANAEYTLMWTSKDETIATVDENGVVTGVKKGQTFIIVETDNGKKAYCMLTVTVPVPIRIELPEEVTIYVGQTITLTPTITPKDAETTLIWTSNKPSVASVDANGVLTGKAEGLALVTVSTSNGLTSDPCMVKVELDPSGVSTVIMDGKADVPIYTPFGQRLAAPRKGINIVGGKKVIVK